MKRRTLISLALGMLSYGSIPGMATSGVALAQSAGKAGGRAPASPLIVLDPGHGGRDPGAIGRLGTQEKDVVLAICRGMQAYLKKQRPNLRVMLTRSRDEFLPLGDRVRIAQMNDADLFVSVHADSAPNTSARGLSAYTLSERASDSFASALATRENRVDVVYGVDLRDTDKDTAAILIDLARRHSHNASLTAKKRIVHGVASTDYPLLENPMRSANFAVLRSGSVPSVLVETGFLSNTTDEKILSSPTRRMQVAQLLAEQIAAVAVDFARA